MEDVEYQGVSAAADGDEGNARPCTIGGIYMVGSNPPDVNKRWPQGVATEQAEEVQCWSVEFWEHGGDLEKL